MKDEKLYPPNDIVLKAQQGDENALARLLEDYRPLVKKAVFTYAPRFELTGYTQEDLTQEANVALLAALSAYDGSKGVTFGAYARRCVRNRLISLARSAARMPRSNGDSVTEIGGDPYVAVLEQVQLRLTPYEAAVFRFMRNGYKPSEISRELDKPVKSVYNAVCRIKAKAKEIK